VIKHVLVRHNYLPIYKIVIHNPYIFLSAQDLTTRSNFINFYKFIKIKIQINNLQLELTHNYDFKKYKCYIHNINSAFSYNEYILTTDSLPHLHSLSINTAHDPSSQYHTQFSPQLLSRPYTFPSKSAQDPPADPTQEPSNKFLKTTTKNWNWGLCSPTQIPNFRPPTLRIFSFIMTNSPSADRADNINPRESAQVPIHQCNNPNSPNPDLSTSLSCTT